MKALIIYISLFMIIGSGGGDGNLAVANKKFSLGEYSESIKYYFEALKEYPQKSAEIRFNIGQCYWELDSLERAIQYYHQAMGKVDVSISSKASNNIGILLVKRRSPREALSTFKDALIQDPNNEVARYNYELLKKLLRGNKNNPPPPAQNQPPPPPSESDQDTEQNNRKPQREELTEAQKRMVEQLLQQQRQSKSNSDRGKPVGNDTISIIQARRLLESMRRNEIQFLQQLRKSGVKPRREEPRPDW